MSGEEETRYHRASRAPQNTCTLAPQCLHAKTEQRPDQTARHIHREEAAVAGAAAAAVVVVGTCCEPANNLVEPAGRILLAARMRTVLAGTLRLLLAMMLS